MNTHAEVDAALAKAEIDWRNANDDLNKAQAERVKANSHWDTIVSDRRIAGVDRRKAGNVWDRSFPDRRNSDADRRIPHADIVAFSKTVTDQHHAYLNRRKAEDDFTVAEVRVNAATAVLQKAVAAFDELNATATRVR